MHPRFDTTSPEGPATASNKMAKDFYLTWPRLVASGVPTLRLFNCSAPQLDCMSVSWGCSRLIDAAKLACRILDPSRSQSSALASWFVHLDACFCWGLVNHLLQECVSNDCCGQGKGGTWGCQLMLCVCFLEVSTAQATASRPTWPGLRRAQRHLGGIFCQRIAIRNLPRSSGPVVAVPVA